MLAKTARRMSEAAKKIPGDYLKTTMNSIDKKIALACAHKLRKIEYELACIFLSKADRYRLLKALVETLRSRGFAVRWSNSRGVLLIRW